MNQNKATSPRNFETRPIGINRVHNSAHSYACPELRNTCHRPGALVAFVAPSRMGATLRHPDGRVTDLDGQLVESLPCL